MANILIIASPQHRDRLVAAVAVAGDHAVISDTLTTAYAYVLARCHKQPDLLVVDRALGEVTIAELADHWHHLPTIIIDPRRAGLHLDDVITLALRFT